MDPTVIANRLRRARTLRRLSFCKPLVPSPCVPALDPLAAVTATAAVRGAAQVPLGAALAAAARVVPPAAPAAPVRHFRKQGDRCR